MVYSSKDRWLKVQSALSELLPSLASCALIESPSQARLRGMAKIA